jgi:nitrogen PTS system EIIA component
MPREQMNPQQVAAYVHLDGREIVKLASRGQIPCRKVRGEYVFLKCDVDHWIESHMHTLEKDRLAGIERGVSAHHGYDHADMVIGPLIPEAGLAVPLHARTRGSVLRGLVDLASEAELVYGKEELLEEVVNREELCSTALWPGVALPHPRHPVPYDIASSFIVGGLTGSGIPFGCPDGSLTRLFFLICCKDERTHLHVLARLAQMLHQPDAVERMLGADSAEQLQSVLQELETTLVARAEKT